MRVISNKCEQKPVLIPVLLAYFSWLYSVMFLLVHLFAAIPVAGMVSFVLDYLDIKEKSIDS